ncbi:MAG: hypothetical protein QOJ03_1862 [Frankiaceae bacterium]|jgi:hypothetical protein|nr:hypothetical protein [Frankiaceae bacterium]
MNASIVRKRQRGRRQLRATSWVAAAIGLSLALAGALAPAETASTAAPLGGAAGTDLRQLLNPSGITPIDPAEEMAAQQALGGRHYGALGLSSPVALSDAIQQGVAQAAQVGTSRRFARHWTLRGPTRYYANDPARSGDLTGLGFHNLAGRVTSIATTSRRPGLVWVGTAGGGVWRSNDAGHSWQPRFDRQGVMSIGGVAIDPRNAARVYVGTGEANTNADAYYGNGMYVTNDGGSSWRHVRLPGVLTVFHVEAVAPSAGFPRGRVFAATNRGLWLSTDHGRHYRDVTLPTNAAHNGVYRATPFGNFVTDVRVRPRHPREVVAVVGWRRGKGTEPNGRIDSVGNGFYRSTSSGRGGTFHYVPQDTVTGLGVPTNNASDTPSDDPIGRTSIAYSADGKYLWAVVQDAGNMRNEVLVGGPLPAKNSVLNGVYVSTTADPGSSWVPKANSQTLGSAPGSGLLVQQADLYGPGVQSWYDQWIAVDPKDDNRVLLGLEEVYEAVANQTAPGVRAQWRTVSRYWNGCALLSAVDCSTIPGPVYSGDTTHPDQHAAAFVTHQNGTTTFYSGSDGGVFSQDSHVTQLGYTGYDNDSWRWLNLGLATTQPYYAVEGSDGTIYAGLQDNGEVKIEPGSRRGDEIYGGDGFDTAVVPRNSNQVYEEYTYGVMSVSTDGGHNWTDITPGDASSTTSQFATPFLLDPRNPRHVVEVGRYIDEGTKGVATRNWSSTYDLGPSSVAGKPGVGGGGVNNIATAVTILGAKMYVPFCGLCDPISQGSGERKYFHVGLATNVKAGCSAAIGHKTCWHKTAHKGLPNRYIQGVAIDPRHPRTVYVALSGYLRRWVPNGNRSGPVYVSHDAGQHFRSISGNLPRVPGNALVVRNGRVFVGTDLGVYSARQKVAHPRHTHWTRVGKGLPNASVLDLRLNPQGSHLVVATHGRGVWTYNFGHKAKPPYRQRGLGAGPPEPTAPTTPARPTAPMRPTVPSVGADPALLAAGLALLVLAAALPTVARRRRWSPA